MVLLWLLVFLPGFFVTAVDRDYFGYRLKDIFRPSLYEINLVLTDDVFLGRNTNFTGMARIEFTVTEITDEVQIHANVLEILSVGLSSNAGINVTNTYLNGTSSILIISLNTTLEVSTEYSLIFAYVGHLSPTTMQGFYRSSYKNAEGQTKYLVTTQFQPVHARRAFPCFDEPHLKAEFDIAITFPKGLAALSNTNPFNIIEGETGDTETVVFQRTPLMSTYLIAFVVSDFTCSGEEQITNNITHRICSSPDTTAERSLANEYSPQVMRALEIYTGIDYSEHQLGKMDQVAVPDFSAGAMENWGIVTYRDAYILYNETETPNSYKQTLVAIVAHEFAHSWFGNLVTCDWWDYIFLNEGFARYFQYFAVERIPELEVDQSWEMGKQFIVAQQHQAFITDGFITSKALTAQASTQAEISGKFDTISYAKGGCIIRMTENFIGSENHERAIQQYLKDRAGSTALPEHLLSALDSNVPENVLPLNTNITGILTNWFDQPGYPLITVSLSGTNVILSQKRFLYEAATDETEWYVPISYTSSANVSQFENVSAAAWLIPGDNLTLTNVVTNDPYSWIILNNQASAYYRINYDDTLWARIKQVLNSNHTSIHVLNRAQIVDDVFNLARAQQMPYAEALSILEYLKDETEYYPWVAAISGFNFLLNRFGIDSEVGISLKAHQLELLQKVYDNVTFDNVDEHNQIFTLKVSSILTAACRWGLARCTDKSKELYQRLRGGTSVYRNIRDFVYCNGLRHSTDPEGDYNFLWDKYQETTVASEKRIILSVLGCVKNESRLNHFMEQTLVDSSSVRLQDFTIAWSSIYGSNPEGADAAFDYVIKNAPNIINSYTGTAALLSNIAASFTKEEQLTKLNTSISTLPVDLQANARAALASARNRFSWRDEVENSIRTYLDLELVGTASPPANGTVTDDTVPVTDDPSPTPGGASRNIAVSFSTLGMIIVAIAMAVR